ncbi:23S rRNA (uracil(1939)-C(5))-methyltransferase RlmD [Almyronema epifaneia]|uniref:23S rRNA (Uracil(1939)-C(5))-methyltransferase RlmD n=1 Tax=Almyronema epifaneia S1 TaxID=2991925 RepID=A0ABW6IHB0_9CYAN
MGDRWQQGAVLDLEITGLNSTGEGVGRWQERVVFVPDTVPGDRVQTRLLRIKPTYGWGKLLQVETASPDRIKPACIVADKCGGCQWQTVAYTEQLAAKQQQVEDALKRIGGFDTIKVEPILPSAPLAYRNKATYPLGRSDTQQVQAGYYRKGTHKLINLNRCPVQDERLDPFLSEIKQDIAEQGWPIYDESTQRGALRHLSLRIGRRTGQVLLTLVSTRPRLGNLEEQAQTWLQRYPHLVGVMLNHNAQQTNAIFGGTTYCVAGQPYVEEQFANLQLRVGPTNFFQVNTEQAEQLLAVILAELNLQGHERVVDAYCGIGTLTLPIADQAKHCLGLEVSKDSVQQAQTNAAINGISNVDFQVGAVEDWLPQVGERLGTPIDVVVLDPPRKGCTPAVLRSLIELAPHRIVYMSCNPATLARDLKTLCEQGGYQLQRVQPADFFPQTAHVECVAFLVR